MDGVKELIVGDALIQQPGPRFEVVLQRHGCKSFGFECGGVQHRRRCFAYADNVHRFAAG